MTRVYNALIAIHSLYIVLVTLFSVHAFSSPTALLYSLATAPNNWTVSLRSIGYQDDLTKFYRIIYQTNPTGLGASFAAGFYCVNPCTIYLFSVFIFEVDDTGGIVTSSPTKVVWSANRSNPVSENATLLLTSDGGLSLHDSDGTLVWFTNVSDHSVSGINITESGNLVLFDQNKSIIWQSFDHPTDTLLMGQKLTVGASLTANVSLTNWSEGQVHLTVVSNGLRAFADSNHKQLYIDCNILQNITENNSDYQLEFTNGSLSFSNYNDPTGRITLPNARSDSIQFIRLEYKGAMMWWNARSFAYGIAVAKLLCIPLPMGVVTCQQRSLL
ncbi:Serine/threonine-protein kinase [Rhynchospora pubera]|uniref:non-specific serine/threonine protein kinase n=1 Tax=Rhynchospora pubera TaxID=906938 RepID=A0AAV8E9P5_9POAL|nr:Serine/threonine-protein kinase [Rhynchospora pubera]